MKLKKVLSVIALFVVAILLGMIRPRIEFVDGFIDKKYLSWSGTAEKMLYAPDVQKATLYLKIALNNALEDDADLRAVRYALDKTGECFFSKVQDLRGRSRDSEHLYEYLRDSIVVTNDQKEKFKRLIPYSVMADPNVQKQGYWTSCITVFEKAAQ